MPSSSSTIEVFDARGTCRVDHQRMLGPSERRAVTSIIRRLVRTPRTKATRRRAFLAGINVFAKSLTAAPPCNAARADGDRGSVSEENRMTSSILCQGEDDRRGRDLRLTSSWRRLGWRGGQRRCGRGRGCGRTMGPRPVPHNAEMSSTAAFGENIQQQNVLIQHQASGSAACRALHLLLGADRYRGVDPTPPDATGFSSAKRPAKRAFRDTHYFWGRPY